MEKSFITIAGVRYRVEVNWNALMAFITATGKDSLDELTRLSDMKATDVAPLMRAAIAEGERLEGREFTMTALDLGAVIRPAHVRQFMDIYIVQSAAQVEPEDNAKKKESQGVE